MPTFRHEVKYGIFQRGQCGVIDDVIRNGFDKKFYACLDSVAKFNLSSNFTTIQNGHQKQSWMILETKIETKSWLS